MFERWKQWRAERRIKPGDGSPLKRFRWWEGLFASRYETDHVDESGSFRTWTVDAEFLVDNKARLYRDGVQHAVSTMPAAFPVPGGTIEVEATVSGMKRVHLVTDAGEEKRLNPVPGTAEHWRATLDQRHPTLSRWMGRLAVVVLLAGLVVVLPQALEQITHWDLIAERLESTFTSPISLPAWANTALTVAGALAAIERALTVRNHWLIDLDTWMLGG